jgi:predicted enzyme related to lactoylglutathione lyase
MSKKKAPIGSIGWFDLTTDMAPDLKVFYESVVGWTSSGLSMGDYDDYVMSTPDSQAPVAGICHARGSNQGLPPQWLMYVNVEDIEASVRSCTELGGRSVSPIKNMAGHGKYCVIQDPAGAVIALFEQE